MNEAISIELDQDTVRFTPDGRLSIIDAIEAVCATDRGEEIWHSIRNDHPEILEHCREFPMPDETAIPVIDATGWDKMQFMLIDYLVADGH